VLQTALAISLPVTSVSVSSKRTHSFRFLWSTGLSPSSSFQTCLENLMGMSFSSSCILSLSTSQRLLSFIQVYVARPVRKITYVLLVFVVRPLSVDASLSPDY